MFIFMMIAILIKKVARMHYFLNPCPQYDQPGSVGCLDLGLQKKNCFDVYFPACLEFVCQQTVSKLCGKSLLVMRSTA